MSKGYLEEEKKGNQRLSQRVLRALAHWQERGLCILLYHVSKGIYSHVRTWRW